MLRLSPSATVESLLPIEHPFGSSQPQLFDALWVRDREEIAPAELRALKTAAGAEQMRLSLGPDLSSPLSEQERQSSRHAVTGALFTGAKPDTRTCLTGLPVQRRSP